MLGMAQNISVGYKQLVDEAMADVETLTIDEARALHGTDDVVFVDIRDIRELNRDGRIPGAVHAPRGMLEFWIDPQSPYHRDVFAQDKRYILFCAAGWRSALACQVANRLGLQRASHLEGGFGGWKEAGGEIVAYARKKKS